MSSFNSNTTSTNREAERYEVLRAAAEAILKSSNSAPPYPSISQLPTHDRSLEISGSTNSLNVRYVSNGVRTSFLVLCTFDVLFISLFWTLTLIVTGQEIEEAIKNQILHYDITSSMFDFVILSLLRFLLCFVFYGFCKMTHWCTVAFTISGTTAFLTAKVLLYKWTSTGSVTFDVMLALTSFILSWVELWFLDFRGYLEEPSKSHQSAQPRRYNVIDENTYLLGSGNLRNVQAYLESNWDGSVGDFFSPFESPESKDDEFDAKTGVKIPHRFIRKTPLNAQESEYRLLGEETLHQAWYVLNSPDWKLEKALANGDTVHTKVIKTKKLFKLTGMVNLPPKLLLEELYFKIESVPKWNPTLTECKLIQPIDSQTDISYQVCAEAGGGVVSTRDFVNLRHWDVIENVYASVGISIKHPAMPVQPKRVRGENGPGGWFMRPVINEPNKTEFQWLLNTDLKGWIPQPMIDSALSGAQFDYITHIRKYAQVLIDNGDVQRFKENQKHLETM